MSRIFACFRYNIRYGFRPIDFYSLLYHPLLLPYASLLSPSHSSPRIAFSRLSAGLYDIHIHSRHLYFLEEDEGVSSHVELHDLTVSEIMTKRPICLRCIIFIDISCVTCLPPYVSPSICSCRNTRHCPTPHTAHTEACIIPAFPYTATPPLPFPAPRYSHP